MRSGKAAIRDVNRDQGACVSEDGDAAARGFVDAVVAPEDVRPCLELALRVALNNAGAHLGQFVLPAGVADA